MTKILALSDTHLKKSELPNELIEHMKGKDHIIHAGDYMNLEIIDKLSEYGEFTGVGGNNDSFWIREKLGFKKIFTIEKVKIGLCHGHIMGYNAFNNAKKIFKDEDVDIIIFGHSHIPMIEKVNGKTYINPGSPTMPRGGTNKSVAEIIIDGSEIEATIVEVN